MIITIIATILWKVVPIATSMLWRLVPESWKQRLVLWLEDHREFVVAWFCLPASFVFTVALRLKAFVRRLRSDPQRHDSAVREIQARVGP